MALICISYWLAWLFDKLYCLNIIMDWDYCYVANSIEFWKLITGYWSLRLYVDYWVWLFDLSRYGVSILMPVVVGVFPCRSESLISGWYVLFIVIFVFSYWALAHGCYVWPADKGKGKAVNQWAWRSRRLVHVGRRHKNLDVCGVVLFMFCR